MNPLTSLYLDFARAIAAIAVVFHHYSNHIVGGKPRVFPDVGQEAVMVFFVLSGFVIRWVAETKEKTATVFFIKRFARFYSVMIPSIAIMLASYFLIQSFNPEIIAAARKLFTLRRDLELGDLWRNGLLTMTFLNFNSQVYDKVLPFGEPFWSLTYEFWYYIIFALFVFIPRRFIALLLITVTFLFLGVRLLLLFPIWLMGVATYELGKRVTWKATTAYLVFALSIAALVYVHWQGWRSPLSMRRLLQMKDLKLNWADNAVYFSIIGFFVSLNFLAFIAWSKHQSFKVSRTVETLIRYPASVAFTLYLTHLPIMFLLKALFDGRVLPYFIPTLTIAIVLWIGAPIEQSKFWYQQQMKRLLPKN
jgi:peptidoglycan/LPS O-acetylase OafA/YrhL